MPFDLDKIGQVLKTARRRRCFKHCANWAIVWIHQTTNYPPSFTAQVPHPGKCRVSIEESSQFASALLMCSVVAGWRVEIVGKNREESPFVRMTREMCSYFHWSRKHSSHPEYGMKDGIYPVDPDSSSGSYFWAAGWMAGNPDAKTKPHPVTVARWPVLGAGFRN